MDERDQPDPSSKETWLTIQEACEEADVGRRTIYNWIKKGRLDVKRTAGGTLRIRRGSLWRDASNRLWGARDG